MNLSSWTPAENEFLAEDYRIDIEPYFRGEKLRFIGGTYGPFKPGKPIGVPLWLAVYLKKRQKCQVEVPFWLKEEYLGKVKMEERENSKEFSDSIPYYYFEIAQLLLSSCEDEFTHPRQTKSLIEDIFSLRRDKLLRVMKEINPEVPVLFLSKAGSAELNYVRPSFSSAYAVVHKMQNVIEEANKQEQQTAI